MDRFIIFAVARSGSSSLCHILNTHPEIICINEPFVPEHATAEIKTPDDLNRELDRIYDSATGIKHVWTDSGWPLPSPAYTESLLQYRSPKIIFLIRRNFLQQYVSEYISQQTSVWQPKSTESGRAEILSHKYDPIDFYEAERSLAEMRERTSKYRQLVASSVVLDLAYEDLFGVHMSLADRRLKIDEIVNFLGFDPAKLDSDVVSKHLDPARSKLNTDETYRLIPNIYQVEMLFGSEENGYLFDGDSSAASIATKWRDEFRDGFKREFEFQKEIHELKERCSQLENELDTVKSQAVEMRRILDLPSHQVATKAANFVAKLRQK
jgi:hypothetical protein